MKHTKGPWVKESNPTIEEKIQIAAFAYDGNRELQIIVRSNNVEDDLDLIAAAPDLLEALKEVVRTLESDAVSICDTIWVSNGSPETLYDYCRAAIAKAEGL